MTLHSRIKDKKQINLTADSSKTGDRYCKEKTNN